MKPSAVFPGRWIPFALATPQLVLVTLFFYWPACKAIWWSFNLVRPFGNGSTFVGLTNYLRILGDPGFRASLQASAIFTVSSVSLAVLIALVLAGFIELNLRGSKVLRNLLIWPYAVAGAVLGVILQFLMNPITGPMGFINALWPGAWAPNLNGAHSMMLIAFAFAWTQVPLNFVIFVAALRAIPADYLAAARIDGAGPLRRFIDIQLPLLAPFVFFAIVINVLESLTSSFGLVDTLTHGGPGGATSILSFRIFSVGFVGLDLSGSSALSVILMLFIVAMTFLQFRFFDRHAQWES
ncbi:ABC transporter permease subunit [Caballeronia sp. SEWSISQ10-4 2]|uniref:carbohydrate ABC transporter permease n=1 Tax=Caballeronia sp. SEWSISQ10-4 2 TaxID=2937438 RepID=UPI0026502259|nr:ABC transporter permease subunit [Caballeronia sp. SEWSISQ10-4 2]MDN7182578.1 ABC transporter permease subunit [Caballeronia sp. SEWSISQ10-4 2]